MVLHVYMRKKQQQEDIKEKLLNVTTQTGDTTVLLLYHIEDCNNEVWMLKGTARVMKFVPVHLVDEQLSQSVL